MMRNFLCLNRRSWVSLFRLEDFHEGALGDVDFADFLHLLFALFLFFPEFALTGDVAAVALGGDVFGDRADGFSADDLAADSRLNRHFEELLRNDFFELGADGSAFCFGLGTVDKAGEGIDRFFIDSDFKFDNVALVVSIEFVVKGAVAASDRFELVVEVGDDLVHRKSIGK